ncbi:MAG TPA: mannosyltransferase family protein [Rudaea sp.]
MRPSQQLSARIFLSICAIFVASRTLLLVSLKVAVAYLSPKSHLQGVAGLLCHWDCIWYLSVADIGYTQKEIVQGAFAQTNFCFSPLLPVVMRLLGYLFHGNILYVGLAFTNACFLAALVYVYRYARLLNFDHRVALLSVALICLLPQSIAFSALLSEGPFLLLLAMAIYHARRGDYLVSGIAAALLSATRSNGVLFIVFALVMVIRQGGFRGLLAPWRTPERFVPLVFAPLGMFVFWAYCFAVTGDAFAQVSAEEHGWNWHFYPVWENVAAMLRVDGQPRYAAIAALSTLACSFVLLREGLYEEFAFCCATIALILSGSGVVSIFRYWIVLFPIWVVVARMLSPRPVPLVVAIISTVVLAGVFLCALALRSPLSL